MNTDKKTYRFKLSPEVVEEISYFAKLHQFDEKKDYDDKIKEVNYQTKSVYGFGHQLYYKNVIEVLQGKTEPETDGREGLKSLEIIIAAYLSVRENKTISLPLEY